MAENSKIEWTASQLPDGTTRPGYTFNHVRGCTKVSAGCAHCYAEAMSGRNPAVLGVWGPNGTRVVASEAMWREPVKWDRETAANGTRPRVFCASLADVFEDWTGHVVDSQGRVLHYNSAATYWVPEPTPHGPIPMEFVRQRLFDLIDATPYLDWLLLTKRPENIHRMWPGGRRENVWLLTSVEDQANADERIPHLLACRDLAPVLGLSMEPLLGPVDLSRWLNPECMHCEARAWTQNACGSWHCASCEMPRPAAFDWAICGGESGGGARPMHPDWARSIRDQCRAAGVAFHFKQWGEWAPDGQHMPFLMDVAGGRGSHASRALFPDGSHLPDLTGRGTNGDEAIVIRKLGKKAAGRLLDGRTWDEFPTPAPTSR